MADGDGVTDVIDLSGNGKGVAINVFPETTVLGVQEAASIAALKLLTDTDRSAYLTEEGKQGMWRAQGSALFATHIANDPNNAYFAQSAFNSDIVWIRDAWNESSHAIVTWFGMLASATAATNAAALEQAFNTCAALSVYSLFVPPGEFDVGAVADIATKPIEFFGLLPNVYADYGIGSTLNFVDDTTGIRVQGYGTSGASTSGGVGLGGHGSHIHHLRLTGAFDGVTESEAHGLHVRGKVHAHDLIINNFSGDGIHGFGHHAAQNGNINGSSIYRIVVNECRWSDYLNGPDANACMVVDVSAFDCRRGGHFDSSLLGNIYLGGDISGSGSHPNFPTYCEHSGHNYAVRKGEEAWCKLNAPSGTTAHNQGWAWFLGAYPANDAIAWAPDIDWYFGAPFCMDNDSTGTSARFEPGYIESGQGPCWMLNGSNGTVRVGTQLVPVLGYTDCENYEATQGASSDGGMSFVKIHVTEVAKAVVVQTPSLHVLGNAGFNAFLDMDVSNNELTLRNYTSDYSAKSPFNIAVSRLKLRTAPGTEGGVVKVDIDCSNGNIDTEGTLTLKPAASATPANNGDMTFELASDTSLNVKVKGSDGVVRSGTITLA